MADAVLADGQQAVTLELLPLTGARPREALAKSRAVLRADPNPLDASIAHQAVGIVLRDFGNVNEAIRELRTAVRLARAAHSSERQADVLATLGITLVVSGKTRAGLANLDVATCMVEGGARGRVLVRRGIILTTLGRYHEALADLRRALIILRRAGDRIWEARDLTWLGLTNLALGATARADSNFEAAAQLWASTSQDLEVAYAIHNRGLVAFHRGDLPVALSYFDQAAQRYELLGTPPPELAMDRCDVLLAAGLATDALEMADATIGQLGSRHGPATKRAELLLRAANAALAAGKPEAAIIRAQTARRLFGSQQRAWWQARADLVRLRAQYAAAGASARLLTAAVATARRLAELGSEEASLARLLAGRMALDLGRADEADLHLLAAARSRRRGPAMSRVIGWLSEALRAEAAHEPRRLLAACRRGLEVLDEHRLTLGASELRAQATAHGTELAALAQRYAASVKRPRLLLAWTERWRATTLTAQSVRPATDPELSAGLAALRAVTGQLDKARLQGTPTFGLQREQQRLEGVVRAGSLRVRGNADSSRAEFDVAKLLDYLGDTALIEIVDVDGVLHVLTCASGQVRRHIAGRADEAIHAAQFARFSLRRLSRSRSAEDLDAALAILNAAGPRLQDAILGAATAHLDDGPVIVVPPGKLHAIPWALLPGLGSRAFSVAPSASAWMRARDVSPPQRQHVSLVRGPGLASEGAEVPRVAELYDDVTVLTGEEASAGLVLSAIDGAWLAHIAAHGSFRTDNPMFSSLRMHDGPLTVYDFEQLARAPYRLVLPSCDSGVLAPVGADELLGLVSSLLPLGTATIIAAVVPLNDDAAVPLMIDLHQHIRDGMSLAESLCMVRRGAARDPVLHAAAISLVSLGYG
jgi:tetratricopeptide (TPR) repeat protein